MITVQIHKIRNGKKQKTSRAELPLTTEINTARKKKTEKEKPRRGLFSSLDNVHVI